MRVRITAAAATALAATALLAASAAPAGATPTFSLRVEVPGATLDPGTYYAVPRTTLARRGIVQDTNSGVCIPATGRHEIDGPTALGLVSAAAQANRQLQPLLVAEDSFGRRVCRIGDAIERDQPVFGGWLFKHNHVSPTFSAEVATLDTDSEVLWVFGTGPFPGGANTGDELVLNAPVRALPGAVQVSVQAITFEGAVAPAPDGTVVTGGIAPATTTNGVATVTVAEPETELRAVSPAGVDIPSAPQSVCVAVNLENCPDVRGRRIVGTNGKDSLKGTPGPDRIRSRGGKDKVRVAGGGADFVNCGKKKDVVVADEDDKVKRCDRVRGPAGKGDSKKRKRGGGKRR